MDTVLILTNRLFGLSKFRKEVIDELIKCGFKVVISAPDVENSSYFQYSCVFIEESPFDRHGMNPIKDISLFFHYIKLIKKHRPKVVLSYTIKPNIYGGFACRFCQIPQIANITGLGDAIEKGGYLSSFLVLLLRSGLRKAKYVVFQNSSNKGFCNSRGIGVGNSILMPGSGVNLSFHTFSELPTTPPVKFVFIGRIKRDKGVKELLEASVILKEKYQADVEIHLVGMMEEDFADAINTAEREGIIVYHGFSQDVRPILKEMHCLVLPSYHEGLSNVCLEASAAGRPVITSDVPGCRETVDDGETGFLVLSKDSSDLVQKMDVFFGLPLTQKREMGEKARRKVEQGFSRQIVVSWYRDAIISM